MEKKKKIRLFILIAVILAFAVILTIWSLPQNRIKRCMDQALVCLNNQQYEQALDLYRSATTIDPYYTDGYLGQIQTCLAIGDNAMLEEILKIDDWLIYRNFCVFGTDFETTLRKLFRGYCEIEEEEKQRLGSSNKPIVAKAVANRLASSEKLPEDIVWRKFTEMAEAIKACDFKNSKLKFPS